MVSTSDEVATWWSVIDITLALRDGFEMQRKQSQSLRGIWLNKPALFDW